MAQAMGYGGYCWNQTDTLLLCVMRGQFWCKFRLWGLWLTRGMGYKGFECISFISNFLLVTIFLACPIFQLPINYIFGSSTLLIT